MDFPIFHLDFFGNRFLIAAIAFVHVVINHSMAVGAMPLITAMEWHGFRRRDQAWDQLAYRVLFVCFVITTTVGALTGVGIWFSASLVNPNAIGSLIRIFFFAWLTEWVIFVLEVIFILIYYLTWKSWSENHKRRHIGFGVFLSVFSWLTMAIIVAILGFMMNSGEWPVTRSFFSGVLNPIYLPQLAFRTPFAMTLAGLFVLFLIPFLTERGEPVRASATRWVSVWVLAWSALSAVGATWYWHVIPTAMSDNLQVAMTTQAFTDWYGLVLDLLKVAIVAIGIVALWGLLLPRWLPRVAMIAPLVLAVLVFGYFERVREFIRKPYVIEGYMYANGIRVADYPLLKEDGILAHATYVSAREITDENRLEAGRDVFALACTRCHTTMGVNGVIKKFEKLYGKDPWDSEAIKGYIETMHNTRPFMPPFPGNDEELDAITAYLLQLQRNPTPLVGAQAAGIELPAKESGAAL